MGFRGGVKLTPPPSISWFSSTPAEIGLNGGFFSKVILLLQQKIYRNYQNLRHFNQ